MAAIVVYFSNMKILNGSEIAEFIKERQAAQVRNLRQKHKILPKLAIVVTVDNPVINLYMRLKKQYGADISVEVEVYKIKQAEALVLIDKLNQDNNVHAIIIQLPLEDPTNTDKIVDSVAPVKDVDALGKDAIYEPATPMAIMWLLAGYNVDMRGKRVLLIGRGKLVGAPLEKIFLSAGQDVVVADRSTTDLKAETLAADIIITAAGRPALLSPDMIKQNTVVVDAGVASEGGKTVGDVAPEVYGRDDLTITPVKGGVGPLTVCALFDNVIRAARESIKS
jgi:methylenetetrahydrofolate dehydrogenase (NADP+)/methenyltetrahydrofolate cyclohydrolase